MRHCRLLTIQKILSTFAKENLDLLHAKTVHPRSLIGAFVFRLSESVTYEPRHEISNDVVCATNKASDQPVYSEPLLVA